MMTRKFHALRRLSGALLLLILIGLPFLRIHGESALRFDVPSLRFLFFGTGIWMQDFFIILIAVIFLTFLILFSTTVFGKIWCGWLCPQTVLTDVTSFVEKSKGRGFTAWLGTSATGFFASAVISVSLVGYFVSPYDLPALLRTGSTPMIIVTGSWAFLTMFLFLDLIALRRGFCSTVCPYAKMQGVLFDDRTLVVAFDNQREKECMHCNACVTFCPVDIDIREGLQSACIHCAECVDACTEKMSRKNKVSLIRYMFGLPGKRGSGLRVSLLLTGGLTAISFAFLVYLSLTQMSFDMNVRLNYAGIPQNLANDSVTNTYTLSLRNMSASDLDLDLNAVASTGSVRISPQNVLLKRGTDIKTLPVSVTLQKQAKEERYPSMITFTLLSKKLDKRITKTVYFVLPKQ